MPTTKNTSTDKPRTPLMQARYERDQAKAALSMYRHLHAMKERGDIPDVVRHWSGVDHCGPLENGYTTRVEIRWWGSTRFDEGYVEVIATDIEDLRWPLCEVFSAMDLRSQCREGSYMAPWRYEVSSMLAMSLAQLEAEVAKRHGFACADRGDTSRVCPDGLADCETCV